VQLLWVNLIMDSLASLALATEKPTDELLDRKPIGKTKSIVSSRMIRFIVSSSVYQIIVLFFIYFTACTDVDPGCTNGYLGDEADQCSGWMRCASGHDSSDPTPHYTIMFNTFVLMQIFNEINSRQLGDEINIFKNICENKIFLIIFFATLFTQVFIVLLLNLLILAGLPLGSSISLARNSFFNTTLISWDQWLYCILFAALGNVWGILARLIIRPTCFKKLEQAGDYKNEDEMMNTLAANNESSSFIGRRTTKHLTKPTKPKKLPAVK